MLLQQKTSEKLRDLITHETEYRSGSKLVEFFNDLGSNDVYGQGFPSRWIYVDSKLSKINGTPELDKRIKKVFAPVNFVGRFTELDKLIKEFNQYLAFDSWQVVRNGTEITFAKAGKIEFEEKAEIKEDDFLKKEFDEISLEKLGLDTIITETLNLRFDEIKICTAYKDSRTGKIYKNYPTNVFIHKYLEPVYETHKGWKTDITKAKTWDELPENAKKYLKRLEELFEIRISIVSVGPDREQTIFVN